MENERDSLRETVDESNEKIKLYQGTDENDSHGNNEGSQGKNGTGKKKKNLSNDPEFQMNVMHAKLIAAKQENVMLKDDLERAESAIEAFRQENTVLKEDLSLCEEALEQSERKIDEQREEIDKLKQELEESRTLFASGRSISNPRLRPSPPQPQPHPSITSPSLTTQQKLALAGLPPPVQSVLPHHHGYHPAPNCVAYADAKDCMGIGVGGNTYPSAYRPTSASLNRNGPGVGVGVGGVTTAHNPNVQHAYEKGKLRTDYRDKASRVSQAHQNWLQDQRERDEIRSQSSHSHSNPEGRDTVGAGRGESGRDRSRDSSHPRSSARSRSPSIGRGNKANGGDTGVVDWGVAARGAATPATVRDATEEYRRRQRDRLQRESEEKPWRSTSTSRERGETLSSRGNSQGGDGLRNSRSTSGTRSGSSNPYRVQDGQSHYQSQQHHQQQQQQPQLPPETAAAVEAAKERARQHAVRLKEKEQQRLAEEKKQQEIDRLRSLEERGGPKAGPPPRASLNLNQTSTPFGTQSSTTSASSSGRRSSTGTGGSSSQPRTSSTSRPVSARNGQRDRGRNQLRESLEIASASELNAIIAGLSEYIQATKQAEGYSTTATNPTTTSSTTPLITSNSNPQNVG